MLVFGMWGVPVSLGGIGNWSIMGCARICHSLVVRHGGIALVAGITCSMVVCDGNAAHGGRYHMLRVGM